MIFNFSWADYDCYTPYIFEGEEKTYEEFKADCNKSLKASFDEFISNAGNRWASLSRWMEFAIVKMKDYGYTFVKPIEFGYCGLEIPQHDKYCTDENVDVLKEYREAFPEFLDEIARMIVYNDAFDKVLHKDIYERIDKEKKDGK